MTLYLCLCLSLCLSLFLFLPLVSAAFSPADLRGPFIRRYGITSCPDNFYIDSSSFNFSSPSLLFVDGVSCSAGTFSVHESPPQAPSGGDLAPYLSVQRGAGTVLGLDVREALQCGNTTFGPRAYFTFLRPDASVNLTVDWRDVFKRNDTVLQSATGANMFTFIENTSYMVINSMCLYSQMTDDEVSAQLAESCFPKSVHVAVTETESVPIHTLKLGDEIYVHNNNDNDKNKKTKVIAWTHKDLSFVNPFLEISTACRNVLYVSHRHYVYTNEGLIPARKVKIGMLMRRAFGHNDSTVIAIETIWRVGRLNPQTAHGNIVVNGFLCSTYTEAVPPNMAHALLAPVRFPFVCKSIAYVLVRHIRAGVVTGISLLLNYLRTIAIYLSS